MILTREKEDFMIRGFDSPIVPILWYYPDGTQCPTEHEVVSVRDDEGNVIGLTCEKTGQSLHSVVREVKRLQELAIIQEASRMKRYIVIVQDKSGSMITTRADAEGGLKAFLEEQAKEEGTTFVALNEFDNVMNTVYGLTPIEAVEPYVLIPGGGTALWDSLGMTVSDLEEHIKHVAVESRPDAVIVLVVTDGEENQSRLWTSERLVELMTKVQRPLVSEKDLELAEADRPDPRTNIHKRGWLVIYMGSNQDAIAAARNMGISPTSSMTYDSHEVVGTYAVASASVSRHSRGGDGGFTDEERKSVSGLNPDAS